MYCVLPLLVVGTIFVLIWRLDPNQRRWRAFDAVLKGREPVDDVALVARFFPGEDLPADVPPRVRHVFARLMNYPADKLLPDDDLTFFWATVDGEPLLKSLGEEFGVTFTDKDDVKAVPTIRAVSRLIASKRPAA